NHPSQPVPALQDELFHVLKPALAAGIPLRLDPLVASVLIAWHGLLPVRVDFFNNENAPYPARGRCLCPPAGLSAEQASLRSPSEPAPAQQIDRVDQPREPDDIDGEHHHHAEASVDLVHGIPEGPQGEQKTGRTHGPAGPGHRWTPRCVLSPNVPCRTWRNSWSVCAPDRSPSRCTVPISSPTRTCIPPRIPAWA